MEKAKVVITGSRKWAVVADVRMALDMVQARLGDFILVEGGALGVDAFAGDWADDNGVEHLKMLADWKTYGNAAGTKRNLEMLDLEPVLVVGFCLNNSAGTSHTLGEAARRKIPSLVFRRYT